MTRHDHCGITTRDTKTVRKGNSRHAESFIDTLNVDDINKIKVDIYGVPGWCWNEHRVKTATTFGLDPRRPLTRRRKRASPWLGRECMIARGKYLLCMEKRNHLLNSCHTYKNHSSGTPVLTLDVFRNVTCQWPMTESNSNTTDSSNFSQLNHVMVDVKLLHNFAYWPTVASFVVV